MEEVREILKILAQEKGYKFDRDAFETNKLLNLDLIIQKL